MKQKYSIKMTMEGPFPGSPDVETFEVSPETYDLIYDIIMFGSDD
jgi:hypothetical protein